MQLVVDMKNVLTLKKMKKIMSLERKDFLLLIETFFFCVLYKIVITFIPFKIYKKYLGKHNEESSYTTDPDSEKTIYRISWAVSLLGKHFSWGKKCLVQALVAQRLLYRRGLESTLYMGVKKEEKNISAHAWLRCGNIYVTGGIEKTEYTNVAKFCLCPVKIPQSK